VKLTPPLGMEVEATLVVYPLAMAAEVEELEEDR